MHKFVALVLFIFMSVAGPATATSVTLIEGGVVNRADPGSEDVFYTAPAVNIEGLPGPLSYAIADPDGYGGSFDFVISTIIGVSDWAFADTLVFADGVQVDDVFVDIRDTPDFAIPFDFDLAGVYRVDIYNGNTSAALVRNPLGYRGDERPFLSVFAADLSRAHGGGVVPTDPLPPPAVPLPAAAWALISGISMLFGVRRLRRSTA